MILRNVVALRRNFQTFICIFEYCSRFIAESSATIGFVIPRVLHILFNGMFFTDDPRCICYFAYCLISPVANLRDLNIFQNITKRSPY